jgi:hypothetical protein
MRARTLAAIVLGAGCLGAAWLAAPRAVRGGDEKAAGDVSAARAALVGRWKLNPELSEDPREKMRQAMQHSGRGMGGGFPGGPGGGGMGHPGGGWGERGGRGRPGGGPEAEPGRTPPSGGTFLSATELTITNVQPEVAIVEPEGLVRNLHPDGRKYKTSSGGEVKTHWDGDRLVVETKSDRGEVKETWSVSPETKRLTLELQIQHGGMSPVSVRRIFDRAEGDSPKP